MKAYGSSRVDFKTLKLIAPEAVEQIMLFHLRSAYESLRLHVTNAGVECVGDLEITVSIDTKKVRKL